MRKISQSSRINQKLIIIQILKPFWKIYDQSNEYIIQTKVYNMWRHKYNIELLYL